MSINNFREIQTAYSKTFNNACELLEESQLLFDNNKNARDYLLAHIAIEELARCIMLASAGMKFKIGALDVKKLMKRQTNHQSKIELAYSFVVKLKQYKSPLSDNDRVEILSRFGEIISQEEIKKLDKLKNASFYVDQYNNQTKMPSEVISSAQANEIITSAKLLRELIEANKWHQGENLINSIKAMDNEQLIEIKKLHYGDKRKV